MSSQNVISYKLFTLVKSKIEDIKQLSKEVVLALASDYIWQKEEFNLRLSDEYSGVSCLYGSTDVCENINDEWFIVYLLYEISKKCRDVVIHVEDTDGLFLLIEAADELPFWLKPDCVQNRVFINNGQLHFIPIPSTPAELVRYPASTPTLKQAVEIVTSPTETVASTGVQQTIQAKLSEYPGKVHKEFHHAHCYLPKSIVYALLMDKQLIAASVQAFYERDATDVTICKKMVSFQAEDRRLSSVRFTRHLYSQMMQARFIPDKTSPWRLPPVDDSLRPSADLGYKVTCGFQILLSRYSNHDKSYKGRKWEQYLQSLKKNDFFKNELEGSKKYKELLEQAENHFKMTLPQAQSSDNVGERIFELIRQAESHEDDIETICANLPLEDSANWMSLTPEELDSMMLKMWGKNYPGEGDGNGPEPLQRVANHMKAFVDDMSSYEGAEIQHDGEIQFEPDVFLRKIEHLLEPPKECDDSDSEEYDSCVDDKMVELMERMDSELKTSSIPKSFTATDQEACLDERIEVNLVKNFLESFSGQDGLSGPVSNILNSMGVALPPDDPEQVSP